MNCVDKKVKHTEDQNNEQRTYDIFRAFIRGELRCDECGKPLILKKRKSRKYFLTCSDPKCKTFIWIEPEMVEHYSGCRSEDLH